MFKPVDMIVEVDLETLGLQTDAVVFSIGAAAAIIGGDRHPVDSFKQILTIEGQEQLGRQIEPDTLKFWRKQSPDARLDLDAAYAGKGASIREAMVNFTSWYAGLSEHLPVGGQIYILGNDPSFDIAKVKSLYQCVGMQPPWFYRNVRCHRTVQSMGEIAGLPMAYEVDPRDGELHDGLSDAVYQVRRAHRIINGVMDRLRATA